MFSAITTMLSSVGGLATSYIDGKTAVQKAEAQIRMKEATGDIDWDLAAIRATQGSWKDEWILLLFSIPLILAFTGDWGRETVAQGFAKQSIIKGLEMSLAEGTALERSNQQILMATDDAGEGLDAFLSKRQPKFKGS